MKICYISVMLFAYLSSACMQNSYELDVIEHKQMDTRTSDNRSIMYELFADCIKERDHKEIKPLIRLCRQDSRFEQLLDAQYKGKKSLIELAQERASRKSIRVVGQHILYAIILALCPTGSIGKFLACPARSGSLPLYTNFLSAATTGWMFKILATDAWYLKDFLHNNSLKIALKLKRHSLRNSLENYRSVSVSDEELTDLINAYLDEDLHNDTFCALRKAIKTHDRPTVKKILAKESDAQLKAALLDRNLEGHKSLIEIARENSKNKSICVRSAKISRIIKAVLFLAIVLFDTYVNGMEIISGARSCSIANNEAQGKTALVFSVGYALFTLLYGVTQFWAIIYKYDKERLQNDALCIYKNILYKTDELAQEDILTKDLV